MKPSDILYHITVASKPTELVETAQGQVPYSDWVEAERLRIIRKGNWACAERAVRVYTNPNTGEMSLVHLRVKDL